MSSSRSFLRRGRGRTAPVLALSAMAAPAPDAEFLARNAVDCLPSGELERKLAQGRPLRVKLGLDPTAPDIHLGHTVVLQKLREFQDLGHVVVLIVGDYTARVGDPSGRSSTRPQLSGEEIDANARTYRSRPSRSARRPRALEMRFNGEWLDMSDGGALPPRAHDHRRADPRARRLRQALRRARARSRCSSCSIRCCRATTRSRCAPTSSSAGTDQTFNLLLGRDVQRAYGQPEQVVLTMPILPGIDGEREDVEVAGQPHRGHRGARGDVREDDAHPGRPRWTRWYSAARSGERAAGGRLRARRQARARAGARRALPRRGGRRRGRGALRRASSSRATSPRRSTRSSSPARRRPPARPASPSAFGGSRSEARRLLAQGGVRLDGEPLGGEELDVAARSAWTGASLQVGKRQFRRLRVAPLTERHTSSRAARCAIFVAGPTRSVPAPAPQGAADSVLVWSVRTAEPAALRVDEKENPFAERARRSLKTQQHAHLGITSRSECASRFDPSGLASGHGGSRIDPS